MRRSSSKSRRPAMACPHLPYSTRTPKNRGGLPLMDALDVKGVVKRFGDYSAVNDLSFSVRPGEVFGFLGGNGAGKTTTLRMALDILRPDAGSISILGKEPGRGNAADIGFLPEERG